MMVIMIDFLICNFFCKSICNPVLCFCVLVFINHQDGHVLATWQHWSIPAESRKGHVQTLDLSRVASSAFVLFITPYFCACIFLHLPGVASSVCTFLTFLLLHIFTRVLLLLQKNRFAFCKTLSIMIMIMIIIMIIITILPLPLQMNT